MCPGFTSAGGNMPDDFNIDEPVAIYAEGKEHALAIGLTKMSTEQIRYSHTHSPTHSPTHLLTKDNK
jgi:predicted ribosome-associated RNA-binding protein Tma20